MAKVTTKKRAKKPKPVRAYVVGYVGVDWFIHGDGHEWTGSPMTQQKARARLKKMACTSIDRAIYRLVPVVVVKGKKP